MKWLIAQGARDVDGMALQKAKAARARLHPREKTVAATLDEIITILERNG